MKQKTELVRPDSRPSVSLEYRTDVWPVWRPLPGWETAYSVSHTGLLWSHHVTRPLSPYLNSRDNGRKYMRVDLRKDGHRRQAYVHHLVLEAHASERPGENPNLHHAHHVDGDQFNNNLLNLRWLQAEKHLGDHDIPEEERPDRSKDRDLPVQDREAGLERREEAPF